MALHRPLYKFYFGRFSTRPLRDRSTNALGAFSFASWLTPNTTLKLIWRNNEPYAVFFLGAVLTCFGSAYYHWAPNDATLVWDRMPMTLAFMSLLAATISERINVKAGQRLLWPLLLAGAGSVAYWRWQGNLWPYAAAQYFSVLLVGLLVVLFPLRYSRSIDLLGVVGLYALAKIAEALDARIFAVAHIISGYTLKHLIAAFAVYWLLRMLVKRSSGVYRPAWHQRSAREPR